VRAAVVETQTGPDGVHLAELPEPAGAHPWAKGRRLLVEVEAAGISLIDVLQARGHYQHGVPAPFATGSEVAGRVVETDPGTGFAVGDRVAGITIWGGVAERALVPPEYAVRLPDTMSAVDGAPLYLNYSTAWFAYERSRVEPGQTVLVHGAAGGVGTAALDLAPAFGVRTIAVVSSDEKEALARECGADEVVRSDGPWLEQVRALTDGRGVHAVLDPVGGDRFTDSLRAMRAGGVIVVIGFAAGAIPEVKVNRLLLRNLTITGISLDTMDAEHPGTLLRVRDAVQAQLDAGRIHPRVARVFAMADTADALRLMDSREVLGKVVVTVP
jgi:NADPH:quinone reductase